MFVALFFVDALVFWPTLFRLLYVLRMSSIVSSFYADSNEQLAQAKKKKLFIFVFLLLLFDAILELGIYLSFAFVNNLR